MTKKELSQLYHLNREIEDLRWRLEELESEAAGCTAKVSGMPTRGGPGDRIGRYAAEIADLKEILECNIRRCYFERVRLERYISGVTDSLVRQVLTHRFVDGLTWTQVAHRIGGGNTGDGCRMLCDRFLKQQV